jgi:hypothetical protein
MLVSGCARQLRFQPCAGHHPVSFDGPFGQVHGGRGLLYAQSSEKPQFDDLRLPGVY